MATTDLITKAKNMLAQTKAEGTKAFKGSAYDQPNVITAQNLAPTKPINLTQPVPSTGAVGMMEELGGMAKTSQDQYTQNLANQATTAKTGMDTSKNELLDYMKGLTGETEATAEAYSQTVDPIQKELTDINNQILSEQQANRRRIQALEKNPTGMLTGALNDEINRVNNESLAKQADLSVIQMGIQGRYSDAKEIADRAVAVKMEQQRNYLDALKFNYQENKELFTKAEQRAFEAAQSDRERALDKEEADLKTISDMSLQVLQNGGSSSLATKVRQAKTVEEAISLAGKYGVDYLSNEIKKATLSKSNLEIKKLQKEIDGLDTPLDTSGLPNTTSGFVTKLMASSKNDKNLDATERNSLSKARTVVNQLDALQSNIAKQQGTSVIKGKTKNLLEKFGLNADVGVINAQLQAITPNLARGTYGEVGVLTDNDIANYRKTLPRLDRPQDQNDAVLALTLKTVLNSMENTLSSASNSGINVSGWTQDYINIKNQINTIEDRIGVTKESVNDLARQNPALLPAIKEMYQNNFTDGEILEALNAR